jgi:hypothetical protein
MPEIGTSGSMSGDGKRSVAKWPKLPRPSSTLPKATSSVVGLRAVLLYLLAQFGMGRVSATQARGAENRQRWSLGYDRPLK